MLTLLGIAESKSAGTKDLLFENATLFGKYGGTCKCGDTEYFVADENNDCKSLACYNGGEAGQCRIQYVYRWAYHGVICNGKEMINNQISLLNIEYYFFIHI